MIPPHWNKDITLFIKSEANKKTQWEKKTFSHCFFKHIRSSEFDEKSRIEGESYLVRIPSRNAFTITQGSIAVLGKVPEVLAEETSGNDILTKYADKAFRVATVSDNTDFLTPHIRIGN